MVDWNNHVLGRGWDRGQGRWRSRLRGMIWWWIVTKANGDRASSSDSSLGVVVMVVSWADMRVVARNRMEMATRRMLDGVGL